MISLFSEILCSVPVCLVGHKARLSKAKIQVQKRKSAPILGGAVADQSRSPKMFRTVAVLLDSRKKRQTLPPNGRMPSIARFTEPYAMNEKHFQRCGRSAATPLRALRSILSARRSIEEQNKRLVEFQKASYQWHLQHHANVWGEWSFPPGGIRTAPHQIVWPFNTIQRMFLLQSF